MSNSKPSSKSTWKALPSARSVQLFGRLVFVACALIATTIWAWPSSQKSEPSLADSSSAGERLVSVSRDLPPAALDHSTKPIEQIRVGERVLAHNPEVSDEERSTWTEPDWSQWLKLSLVMPKEDGSELKMELLRSEDWVRSQMAWVVDEPETPNTGSEANDFGLIELTVPSIELGDEQQSVPLSPLRPIFRDFAMTDAAIQLSGMELTALLVEMDLPELAITGPAVVTDIQPAPAVESDEGRVVTATFHHSSGDVIDLTIGDERDTETIGTTSNHPFWSVDRQEYVQAGTLELGERVQTYAGDTKQVVSKLPRPGPEAVYNMEVHGEHVYYVGQQGLLVHNTYSRNAISETRLRNAKVEVRGDGSKAYYKLNSNRRWQKVRDVAAPRRSLNTIEDHHSIPQFVGGNARQSLTPLPQQHHKEIHRMILSELKQAGFGAANNSIHLNSSSEVWEAAFRINPVLQVRALKAVGKATRKFDSETGHHVFSDFISNIRSREFRRAWPMQ